MVRYIVIKRVKSTPTGEPPGILNSEVQEVQADAVQQQPDQSSSISKDEQAIEIIDDDPQCNNVDSASDRQSKDGVSTSTTTTSKSSAAVDPSTQLNNQIQAIFDNHPGLFSFLGTTTDKNVWCKACACEVPLAILSLHIMLPIHLPFYQKGGMLSGVHLIPNIQTIINQNPGVFSPCADEGSLMCNACKKTTTKVNLLRHLKSTSHQKKVEQANKKEVDYSSLTAALNGQVFSQLLQHNVVYCNVCEVKVNDSLSNLLSHVKSAEHRRGNAKKREKMLEEFGEDASVEEEHSRAHSPTPEEFHRDLARLFNRNQIPLKRLHTMRPFLSKYTKLPIPGQAMFRKLAVEDKKLQLAAEEEEEEVEEENENENEPTTSNEHNDDHEMTEEEFALKFLQ